MTHWTGEAMHATDQEGRGSRPQNTASATTTVAADAAHLAQPLRDWPYPST